MKNVWHVSAVAIIILATFLLGEFWHLVNPTRLHHFADKINTLDQDYFELFRNRNINWLLYSLAVFISVKYNNWKQTKWVYFILIFYFIADTILFYYNNNTKYESLIYILCASLDIITGLYISSYLYVKNKHPN
jgi:hypothetical protein